MGGGQNNSAQAAQQNAQATAAEQAQANLANNESGLMTKNYNYLFGSGGPGSSTGGSLSQFLTPPSSSSTTLTGPYATQYKQGTDTLNQNYANQRGTLAQQWANTSAPNSTPSGFQADQQRQLAQSEAGQQGQLFTGLQSQQYQTALQNFWNATNIAAGTAAQAGTTAEQAQGSEGQTAANIYGTAGAYHQSPWTSIIGSGLQAGGQVGAAALCPASGAKIRTKRGDVKVEALLDSDELLQPDGSFAKLAKKPSETFSGCVRVSFEDGSFSLVSHTHEFILPSYGYVKAVSSAGKTVKGEKADLQVTGTKEAGIHSVWIISPFGLNAYLCDGIWSLV